MPGQLPPLRELAPRVLLVGAAVIWLAHACQSTLLRPLLPAMSQILSRLDPDLKVLSVVAGQEGPNRTVTFEVNLRHPVVIGGRTVYPYGWGAMPAGSLEVNLDAAGLLEYAALSLIVVLAWPPRALREFLLRLALALPPSILLLLVPGPSTALSLVWGPFHQALASEAVWPSLAWSRFLSGGGGLALALVSAISSIGLAARTAPPEARR
ncbi:MAG TPA: hypothetical protein VHB68_15325 [Steroidobacteraceae bacterium]|nr:hypothetical protein [Steroidobacteraceae bacterium]